MTGREGDATRAMAGEGERLLQLLTLAEVAELLGGGTPHRRCSVKRVRRLAAEREIQMVKLGALTRYTAESVAAYQQRQAS